MRVLRRIEYASEIKFEQSNFVRNLINLSGC